ncbi:unnamed protein product [Amoebophrya sp. A25]|nr:unnamed protein product [Amoebophrya sp. A25]|eukprot:GSA25T00019638001.1
MPVGGNRSTSAPVMQRYSNYEAAPRYSITGKWKILERNQGIPAANKYDTRELIKYTSKYGQVSNACGFGSAPRWGKNKEDGVTGGPGQYETARSTIKRSDISFGKSTRPDITGVIEKGPGPGQYEVRDKNNKNDPSMSPLTIKFAGRHGWYYENPEDAKRPGPGTYSLNFVQCEAPVGTETKIGTGLRPSMESHLGVDPRNPSVGPGHYKHLTTLGGAIIAPYNYAPRYSFTTASYRTKTRAKDDPDMILQPTQFPKGGFSG